MTVDDRSLSAEQLLSRRMLWNRKVEEQFPPQPVVVLLGPTGSGKTSALKSISEDCGSAMVHAGFDFADAKNPTTVQVLARASFEFSRNWPARGTPRFTRFTLGLIAVQPDLTGRTRDLVKEELRKLITDFTRNPRAARIAQLAANLAEAAVGANLLSAALGAVVTKALPALIREIGRKPIDKAQRWHADIPQAQGAEPLDALATLNQQARLDPAAMVGWLTSAFLADVRESQPKLARRDPHSDCGCPNKSEGRHYHNWLLLLDNVDHPGGAEFVEDLLAARQRHLRQQGGPHDALLVIGTSGRWNDRLTDKWRPPWQAEPAEPDGLHTALSSPEAGYQHWAQQHSGTPHYPVLLAPLTIDETARALGAGETSASAKLAQRITSGLPSALKVVAPFVIDPKVKPGARDLLLGSHTESVADGRAAELELWCARLAKLRITSGLDDDISVDDIVLAAPFATAPWLVPGTATLPSPEVSLILAELRTALWVSAPANGGGTADYAELHPWISRTLVSALTARSDSAYDTRFKTLLVDPDTKADPARTAYCQLALGRVSEVITMFEETFNDGPHRPWVDRLRLVTRAPDNRPPDKCSYPLYQQFVHQDNRKLPDGRSPVGNIVRRLVIARWLAANPFATPDPKLAEVVETAYRDLRSWARQPDVSALSQAAQRDLHELF